MAWPSPKYISSSHPKADIVVVEASSTVGGVWAKHRLYPDLRTNNIIGRLEYPDYLMDKETYGVKTGEDIPGAVVHKYLTN